MINITMKSNELIVNGHANFKEAGKDIICAGVSTLTYTLAQNIKLCEDYLEKEPIIVLKNGKARIKCIPKNDYKDAVSMIFQTVFTGLQMLKGNYPDFISIDG